VLVVGDSLSAEYGLKRGSGWVQILLEQRLIKEGHPARMVNASISGDTTSGGRSRLPALLKLHKPAVVVIELGGNDALRGLPLNMTRENLTAMARAAKAGAKVLIVGMEMPPNYGASTPGLPRPVPAGGQRREGRPGAVPAQGRGRPARPDAAVPGRPHPPERGRPAHHADNVWPNCASLLPKR
jgi:acyl-CoA thioesterase I